MTTSFLAGDVVNLNAGNDSLTLAGSGNILTLAATETLIGGAGDDTVTFTTLLTSSSSVDMGAGTDTLTLANSGANVATITNAEIVTTGLGNNDVITFVNINGSADLSSGTDTVTLAGNNVASLTAVETVIGGTGNDAVTLNEIFSRTTFDFNGGTDSLTLAVVTILYLSPISNQSSGGRPVKIPSRRQLYFLEMVRLISGSVRLIA